MSLVTVLGVTGCQKNGPAADPNRPVVTEILEQGQEGGQVAEEGDRVFMLYEGTLADGTRFDANIDDPDSSYPYAFILGQGSVIKGWDEGIQGMVVGEKRKLVIPWEKAYGPTGDGNKIPPKADLTFEVQLVDIVKKGEENIYDVDVLKEGAGPEVKKGDKVRVHYVGHYVNGHKFDDTREKNDGNPVEFVVGEPEVILGVDHGVIGMKKGETRRLRIPPALGWGGGGSQSVQGGQIIILDVELLSVNGA